jgi:hypothetical protein
MPRTSGQKHRRALVANDVGEGGSLVGLPADQLYTICNSLTLADVCALTLALGKAAGGALRAALAELAALRRSARTRHCAPAALYARWSALPAPCMGALATLSADALVAVVLGAATSGGAVELSRLETLARRHEIVVVSAGERMLRVRQTAREHRSHLAMVERCLHANAELSETWRQMDGDALAEEMRAEAANDESLPTKLVGAYATVLQLAEDADAARPSRAHPRLLDERAQVWLGRHSAFPVKALVGATSYASAAMTFSHLVLAGLAARRPQSALELAIGESCDLARIFDRVLDQPLVAQAAGPAGRRGGAAASAAERAEATCADCGAGAALLAWHCPLCRYARCAPCAPAGGRHRCDPTCNQSSLPEPKALAQRMNAIATMARHAEREAIECGARLEANAALFAGAYAQRDWLGTVDAARADACAALARSASAHESYVRRVYGVPDPFATGGPR